MAPVPSSLSTLASAALSSSVSSCSSFSHAGSPLAQGNSLFAMKCKAGMSPITQEQLERYAVLDTEELVRQVLLVCPLFFIRKFFLLLWRTC